jgi:hypothetical protein
MLSYSWRIHSQSVSPRGQNLAAKPEKIKPKSYVEQEKSFNFASYIFEKKQRQ